MSADPYAWPDQSRPFSCTALPDGTFALCGPMQPSHVVFSGTIDRTGSLVQALAAAANEWHAAQERPQ